MFVYDENMQIKYIKSIFPGDYFGEVAMLKECSRTATVKSKGYTTCASLEYERFEKLLLRYSFVRKAMETRISKDYQDKWRNFIKRALRNVEFLAKSIPEEIIEEISYKLDIKSISKGDYLFKVGEPCKEIYIICKGRMELLISNKRKSAESFLDTVYTGCSIGSYSCLNTDDYALSGRALTDCTVLKLEYLRLEQMRQEYEELEDNMSEYEQYIEENGLPYCDYKLHRGSEWEITPIEKFQNGINRIIRIVKSYKANTFTDLLKKVQEKVKNDRNEKNKKWRDKAIKVTPQSFEEKMEKYMLEQSMAIQQLTTIVNKQTIILTAMQKCRHFECNKCGSLNEVEVPNFQEILEKETNTIVHNSRRDIESPIKNASLLTGNRRVEQIKDEETQGYGPWSRLKSNFT